MDKRKSIDGFIPINRKPGDRRTARGIPANELVPLPTPNGNDLKIKGYNDFVSTRGAKTSKPPVHTIEDFLDDSVDLDSDTDSDVANPDTDLDKPLSRTRGGLLPDYDDRAEKSFKSKREDRKTPKSFLDDDLPEEEDESEDQPEEYPDSDPDNDLGVDDEDIKNYRSRRFKREKRESPRNDESNVVLRVIGGAVIVVITICVTYFMFSLFYKAPEPAKIDDKNVVKDTTNKEEPKPEEKPVEIVEQPATIAVYNATTTAGLAQSLVDTLVSSGKNATLGGNASMTGTGYAIFDFTGGKKPKNLAVLKEALDGQSEVITVTSTTILPADVQSDKDFVIIIR